MNDSPVDAELNWIRPRGGTATNGPVRRTLPPEKAPTLKALRPECICYSPQTGVAYVQPYAEPKRDMHADERAQCALYLDEMVQAFRRDTANPAWREVLARNASVFSRNFPPADKEQDHGS